MNRDTAVLLAVCAALLGGCNGSGDSSTATAPDPATLCVSSACGQKTALLDIPGAENLMFSPNGRLFVSGSQNVYEITRPGGAWQSTALYEGTCNFTGLALRGEVLYANCFDGQLYAGSIATSPVRLQPIHNLGLGAPNGLATGPDGSLYLANGPVATTALPDPKLVRLHFGSDPFVVIEQADWLPLVPGLDFPNGVQWGDGANGRLYFSQSTVLPVELGAIRTVTINSDGSAGTVTTLGSFAGLPDDFSVTGEHVLYTSYSNNQIGLLSPAGAILAQTTPLISFDSPSAARLGQPPLFAPDEILVTEKGLIGLPPTPGYGSRLSVFRRVP